MDIEYYCLKQKKVVLTRFDMFKHPDLGMRPCYVCRECGGMAMLKEEVKKNAV